MDAKYKPRIQPLNTAVSTSTLLSGYIVKCANEAVCYVIDSWQKIYPVSAQCQLLPQLHEGDHVVFCVLDNDQVVVLNRLTSLPSQEANKLELAMPGIKDSFIRITEEGIHLQAGKASLQISKDGTINIDSRNLSQTAKEVLLIKGGNVRIN